MSRGDVRQQLLRVLGVSLGASAVSAVLGLAEVLIRSSVAQSTATPNRAVSGVALIDVPHLPAGTAAGIRAGETRRRPEDLRW